MSFPQRFDDQRDLGPPPPAFRLPQRTRPGPGRWVRWVVLAGILLILFILAGTARHIYTQVLWFQSVGYASVYARTVTTQVWLFGAGFALSFAFLGGNLLLARRLLPHGPWVTGVWSPASEPPVLRRLLPQAEGFIAAWSSEIEPPVLRRLVTLGFAGGAVAIALIFGAVASARWQLILQFLHAQRFGEVDSAFGRDISFYIFRLPAWHFFQGWALGLAIVTLLAVVVIYLASSALRAFTTAPSRGLVLHLSVLVLVVLSLFGWGYWLNILSLPNSSAGIVYGATYTDLHARRPVYYLLIGVLGLVMALVAWSAFRRRLTVPLVALGSWVVIAILARAIYPAIVQRFQVDPNEFTKERPYIARNIEATRRAFDLDRISERDFPAEPAATEADVRGNQGTIDNIRLWDVRPLADTYNQVQAIRPLYLLNGIDVDRYTIDGRYRQVMLAARELSQDRLPEDARGWVNRRLQFTHGYGLAMSPVNEVVGEGLPAFFVQDIPPRGPLTVTRPAIYFGEVTGNYVITNGKQQEFDYPSGQSNVYNTYDAAGGVGIGNLFRRFVYAWEFADANILISQELSSDSRILYRRNVEERAIAIAPFLRYDPDPYLVVLSDRLVWVLDAYTTADDYPYSEPSDEGFNYIRNSVKVVIDAYDGTTTFYVVDPSDPLLLTYSAIYPDLFTPLDQMTPELRAHLRYPEGLLQVQAQVYSTYHMTEPQVFYNKEDLWKIPSELFADQQEPVRPYYAIMKLPGEANEEFVLILPFSPANRDNTVAWMAARSDGDNYGSLTSFRFPNDRLVYGPAQIEARIDQDALISQQLTLWNQSGSRVIRGNLLMIPIEKSVIYVEPIFLQAEQSKLPELKRVVVANGNDIAMEPTLARAFDVLFGRATRTLPGQESGGPITTPTPSPTPTASPTPPPTQTVTPAPSATASPTVTEPPGLPDNVKDLAAVARATYERAQEYLRQGDLEAYGREIAKLEPILDKLSRLTGNP